MEHSRLVDLQLEHSEVMDLQVIPFSFTNILLFIALKVFLHTGTFIFFHEKYLELNFTINLIKYILSVKY